MTIEFIEVTDNSCSNTCNTCTIIVQKLFTQCLAGNKDAWIFLLFLSLLIYLILRIKRNIQVPEGRVLRVLDENKKRF